MAATTLPDPVFISSDVEDIVAALITFYETETGQKLSPAQIERLLINAWAYREALVRSGVNEAAKMNLVAFAIGVILDYLGQLVGVTRLPQNRALTTLGFELVNGHGAVTIPQGLRVSSTDGKAVFRVIDATPVGLGTDFINVTCECESAGMVGNNYAPATVTTILDPQAYLVAASNVDITAGGSDVETDEQMRVRIYLAPSSFGTAGSEDAYKYWAFTANQSIIDVEVENGGPGIVNVYPLIGVSGGTPQPILDQVDAVLSPKNRRPLNDQVDVISPADVTYSIDLNITLFDTAEPSVALQNITDAVTAYSKARRNKLGLDAVIDQIKGVAVIPNVVYSCGTTLPAADIIVTKAQYADCLSININIIAVVNG